MPTNDEVIDKYCEIVAKQAGVQTWYVKSIVESDKDQPFSALTPSSPATCLDSLDITEIDVNMTREFNGLGNGLINKHNRHGLTVNHGIKSTLNRYFALMDGRPDPYIPGSGTVVEGTQQRADHGMV